MLRLDREGTFRLVPFDWRIVRPDSGAVGINIDFMVLEGWEDGEWQSWEQYDDYEVSGTWWVVKKDRSLNNMAVEQLVEVLGWDKTFTSVANENPPDVRCQGRVERDDYGGKVRYKADWLQPWDASPEGPNKGGSGHDSHEADAKELQNLYGAMLRATKATAPPRTPSPKTSSELKQDSSEESEQTAGEAIALTKQEANKRLAALTAQGSDADSKEKLALLRAAEAAGLEWSTEKKEFTDGLPF